MFQRNIEIALLASALGLVGCGVEIDGGIEENVSSRQERTICGPTDDMQHVELYDGSLGPAPAFVALRQLPVGNIKWRSDLASRYTNPGNVNGQRWCTGTMLTIDIMITAGHCYDVDLNGWTWPRSNATGQPITPPQAAPEMQVDFNYQLDGAGNPRAFQTFNVTELVEYRLGGVDYALIRLQGSPGATFGTSVVTPFVRQVAQAVTLIQHPNGERKQIHSGPLVTVTATAMTYATADTEGGSSGSGILDEGSGLIHGIHTNGGCNAAGGVNKGVPVSAIHPVSPLVHTLGFDAAKLRAIFL